MLEPVALLNRISFLRLLLFLIVASDLDFICYANRQVQPKTKPCFRSRISLTHPPVITIMLRLGISLLFQNTVVPLDAVRVWSVDVL